MVNQVYDSLSKYFTRLSNVGYVKQSSVEKILLMSLMQEMMCVLGEYLTEEDYLEINKALYCLYGSDCLISYPDYYNPKTKRVMFTGSCSDLLRRVEELEEYIANCPCDNFDDIAIITDYNAVDSDASNPTIIVPDDDTWDCWRDRELIVPAN